MTGGMGCPFLLHVTSGEGLPWASHGRTTSVPTSAAIWTMFSWPLTPIILGMAWEKGKEVVRKPCRLFIQPALYLYTGFFFTLNTDCKQRSDTVLQNDAMLVVEHRFALLLTLSWISRLA